MISIAPSSWRFRVWDILCRVTVLGSLFGIAVALYHYWPSLVAACSLALRVVVNSAVMASIYAVFIMLGCRLLVPIIIGKDGWANFARISTRMAVWLLRFIVVGVINTFVLIIQVAYAVLQPSQSSSQRVVNAFTHYLQSTANLGFGLRAREDGFLTQ